MNKTPHIEQIVLDILRRHSRAVSVSPVQAYARAAAPTSTPADDAVFDSTDDLAEGATNLYFSDARVYAAVKAQLLEGANITITADDEALTLTIAASGGGGLASTQDGTLFFGAATGTPVEGFPLVTGDGYVMTNDDGLILYSEVA